MSGPVGTAVLRRRLRRRLVATRRRTLGLVRELAGSDVHDQFVPFLSPLVWDLGHIGNFEELWLLRVEALAGLERLDLADPERPLTTDPRPDRVVDDEARVVVPAGPVVVGPDRRAGTYDNERPAPRREVDGGGGWRIRRLGRLVPLDPREPVQHVGFFEAEAFARWAGGRLPTELAWEKVAGWDSSAGARRRYPWGQAPPTGERANVGLRRDGPAPVGSYPAGASAYGAEQLAGDVYEWTTSAFEPYPGFRAFPYEEYSQVFFGGDWRVLRGASWAADPVMARVTYRNWDHPHRRQLFAGLRVAYDLDPA